MIPVPIHPWPPTPADLELLKAVKATLDLPYKIVPVEALPGSPGRVLAFREDTPLLVDSAVVTDPGNTAALQTALSWVLDPTAVDARASLVIDKLRGVFGPDVEEVLDA